MQCETCKWSILVLPVCPTCTVKHTFYLTGELSCLRQTLGINANTENISFVELKSSVAYIASIYAFYIRRWSDHSDHIQRWSRPHPVWPHSFSSVNATVSWITLKKPQKRKSNWTFTMTTCKSSCKILINSNNTSPSIVWMSCQLIKDTTKVPVFSHHTIHLSKIHLRFLEKHISF